MDSEDSRDGSGDTKSSSSSSSSSSRSRRSSSSERSGSSNKKERKSPPRSPPGSPPQSPRSEGPRSPSPESQSQSLRSPQSEKQPHSPGNLSGAHSDINSPENSMPLSPVGPKSPEGPKSPSDGGSNIGSPNNQEHYSAAPGGEGPKTPQSPNSSARSGPRSPEPSSHPASPDSNSPSRNPNPISRSPSASPERRLPLSPSRSSLTKKDDWGSKETWRRHTKAEQKMVEVTRRSRSNSSTSSRSRSSSYNKRSSSNKDPATEEISEGEMESDQEDRKSRGKSESSDKPDGKDLNISHEDLSDVSDLDSGPEDTKNSKSKSPPGSPLRKQDLKVNGNGTALQSSPKSESGKTELPKLEKVPQEKTSNTEDGEEQLDFEAEEGECIDPKPKEQSNGDAEAEQGEEKVEEIKPGKRSRGSSLEEGELSDEGERRPEENEPRPVCRFFSRGACTWGVSCRFLHPGVTDKGNYNMFDVVRGVPAGGAYPASAPRDAAPPESAWERGLRTAKEMLRIANKRKEQDMDFEEKKLHLSLGGVVHDPDAELAYAAAAVGASPPHHHDLPHRDMEFSLPSRTYGAVYRGRGFPRPADDRERYYERERERERGGGVGGGGGGVGGGGGGGGGYERERVYERAPPHYDERQQAAMSEDMQYHKQRRVRSSREVIVQRAEVERRDAREMRDMRGEVREGRDTREGREGRRGDEWADPWMRAEPAARRRRPPSSDDSYSSSSSRSSRSPTAGRKRRASSSSRQRLSPSVIVRERRLASARATAMNPPAPRRRAPSPTAARQLSANPPAPLTHRHKDEIDPYGRSKVSSRNRDRKKYSKSSSSGSGSESSSSSSESESESHSSSTSGSSGARRARHARLINAAARPRMNSKNAMAAAVTIPNKKEASSDKEGSKKRSATSPVSGGAPAKKSVSRREELLKQLKAVEDAIARKRSKI